MHLWKSLRVALDFARTAAKRMRADRDSWLRHVTRAREIVRRALAGRAALRRYVTWRRALVALVVLVAATTIAFVLFDRGEGGREASHASLPQADPIVVGSPDNHAPGSSEPRIGAAGAPFVNLPPPPAPSSEPRR
jgi:hypothetical protein